MCNTNLNKYIRINPELRFEYFTSTINVYGKANKFHELCAQTRGGGFPQPTGKPLRVVFFQFFFHPAKLIFNCRSHAKGDSQEFKIEEIEEH